MKGRLIIIAGVLVGVIGAIVLHTIVKHTRKMDELRDAMAFLDADDPNAFVTASPKFKEDDIDLWLPMLLDAARGDSPVLRHNAITMLGEKAAFIRTQQRKRTLEALARALGDEEGEVCAEAADVLTRKYRDRGCAPKLRTLAAEGKKRECSIIKFAAIRGLGYIAQDEDFKLIVKFLSDHDNDLARLAAIEAMNNIATVKALDKMLVALPAEGNIHLITRLVFHIGDLAGQLSGKGATDRVVVTLDVQLKNMTVSELSGMELLAMDQASEFMEIAGIPFPTEEGRQLYVLEKYYFSRLLIALRQWGKGDNYTVLLDRLEKAYAADDDEYRVFEAALSEYVDYLLTPGDYQEIKDADVQRLRDICKLSAAMLDGEGAKFAREQLEKITGLKKASTAEWNKWLKACEDDPKKFKPAKRTGR